MLSPSPSSLTGAKHLRCRKYLKHMVVFASYSAQMPRGRQHIVTERQMVTQKHTSTFACRDERHTHSLAHSAITVSEPSVLSPDGALFAFSLMASEQCMGEYARFSLLTDKLVMEPGASSRKLRAAK